MNDFEDIPSAVDAARMLLIENWDNMPGDVRQKMFDLGKLGSSPVDLIVQTAEIIYARADELPADAKDVGARLFRVGANNGWHGLNDDKRGENAAKVLEGKSVASPPLIKNQFRKDGAPMLMAPPAPIGVVIDGQA